MSNQPNPQSIASRYAWSETNRNRDFDSFEDEIFFMESNGYQLVQPEYRIPHWSEKLRRKGTASEVPTLYILRNGAPDQLTSHLDCYAAQVGYPVYFKL